ncbi:MAG: tRNA pseudouridine(38-40) synthase TruA [Spirochaetota bacterium]
MKTPEADTCRNIAVKIAYQGQGFVGWQSQARGRTVEDELRGALGKLHKTPVSLYAAGRTDSGVHATGQVANFYSHLKNLSGTGFRVALNSLLPKDIRIRQSWEVPPDFHARYSARMRVYHYRMIQGQSCSPDQRQNAWYVRSPKLDTAVLNCMVSPLIGEHDFSAFALAGDQAPTKIRTLSAASFYCEGPYLIFRIAGNAFLWRMVRSIVGTVVGLYSQRMKALQGDFLYEQIYEQRHDLRRQIARRLAGEGLCNGHVGFSAPAHGLTLTQVVYPQEFRPQMSGTEWVGK